MTIREIRARIFANATPEQHRALSEDSAYGAPYSFWASAVSYGLATPEEQEQARLHYRDLWHYRGD